MTHQSFDARIPRGFCTSNLKYALANLDRCSSGVIVCDISGCLTPKQITVTGVWVVGSYARGATHCMALDLVVQTTGDSLPISARNKVLLGRLPDTSGYIGSSDVAIEQYIYFSQSEGGRSSADAVKIQMLGYPLDVRVYLGTPADNESGIYFSEAVQVWGAGIDSAEALSAIVVDATVGRFPRKADAIPLRHEQVQVGVDFVENLIDTFDQGIYTWSFITLDTFKPVHSIELVMKIDRYNLNNDKRLLIPYVQAYIDTVHLPGEPVGHFKDDFWVRDDVWVLLGVGMPAMTLLNRPGISRLAVMPNISARGPNGIWVIERGPEHALTKAFSHKNAAAWLVGHEGNPSFVIHEGPGRDNYVRHLEVFTSKEEAQAHIDELYADEDTDEFVRLPEPMFVTGPQYLDALRGVDMVEYVGTKKVIAFSPQAEKLARDIDANYPGAQNIPDWFNAVFQDIPVKRAE